MFKWRLRKRVLKKAYKRSIILKYIFVNEGMTFNLNKLVPVVKKLKLGKVYNNNINDKERTNFDQDSGPIFDLRFFDTFRPWDNKFLLNVRKNYTQFKSFIITCNINLKCNLEVVPYFVATYSFQVSVYYKYVLGE